MKRTNDVLMKLSCIVSVVFAVLVTMSYLLATIKIMSVLAASFVATAAGIALAVLGFIMWALFGVLIAILWSCVKNLL